VLSCLRDLSFSSPIQAGLSLGVLIIKRLTVFRVIFCP
jgi:hypothetical protein